MACGQRPSHAFKPCCRLSFRYEWEAILVSPHLRCAVPVKRLRVFYVGILKASEEAREADGAREEEEGPREEAPEVADIGRRLSAFWAEECVWYTGVLTAIEAGRDDGKDEGAFHVVS